MHSSSRHRSFPVLVLALLAIAWGAIPLFVRNDVSAVRLVGVRVTFGAIALVIVAAGMGRLTIPKVRRWRLAFSGVILALHWITFFESIKLTTVAIALAVLYLGPIAAAILAGPLLGERSEGRLWIALATAGIGTLLVVQPWGSSEINIRGLAMAGLSAALLAVLMLSGKPVAKDLGGLTMATGELLIASVLLAPATYRAVVEDGEFIINFIILGAVFTGLAGYLYWETMRQIPVALTSVVMYLEPASAVVWALIFLDEVPNAMAWIGVGLVIAGGIIAATVRGEQQEAIGAQAAL